MTVGCTWCTNTEHMYWRWRECGTTTPHRIEFVFTKLVLAHFNTQRAANAPSFPIKEFQLQPWFSESMAWEIMLGRADPISPILSPRSLMEYFRSLSHWRSKNKWYPLCQRKEFPLLNHIGYYNSDQGQKSPTYIYRFFKIAKDLLRPLVFFFFTFRPGLPLRHYDDEK